MDQAARSHKADFKHGPNMLLMSDRVVKTCLQIEEYTSYEEDQFKID